MEERILLVEDEEKLARMVELELNYEGYQVEKAFDGRRGLELALSGRFDLILLDIMLPALSGMEVLRRLRRESQTPVIMLTARDTVVDKVSGLDMGADDYITKPFVWTGIWSLWTARTWPSPAGSSTCCAACWSTRKRSSPGRNCWSRCGALTSWARPTP